MTFSSLLRLLGAGWKVLFAALIAGVGLGIAADNYVPKTYQSQAVLLVSGGDRPGSPMLVRMPTLALLVRTATVLEPAAQQVDYPGGVNALKKVAGSASPDGTAILLVTAKDTDPERSAEVANAIAANVVSQIAALDTTTSSTTGPAATTAVSPDVATQPLPGLSAEAPAHNLAGQHAAASVPTQDATTPEATTQARGTQNGAGELTPMTARVVEAATPPSAPTLSSAVLVAAGTVGMLLLGVIWLMLRAALRHDGPRQSRRARGARARRARSDVPAPEIPTVDESIGYVSSIEAGEVLHVIPSARSEKGPRHRGADHSVRR